MRFFQGFGLMFHQPGENSHRPDAGKQVPPRKVIDARQQPLLVPLVDIRFGASVQPDDGRADGLPFFVQQPHAAAVPAQRDAGNIAGVDL